jgi:hypothetical protein
MESLFSEYESWKKENEALYEELHEHDTLLFDRFYPVYEVMSQIDRQVTGGSLELDESLKKIFDVGFAFLHDQFETVKMYLETNFKNDLHAFLEYEAIVNDLLFIEDVRYEMQEKNLDYDNEMIEDLLDELEAIIDERKPVESNLGLYIDGKLSQILGERKMDFYGIIDIFSDVAETLGIYLYEDEDIVIGKDF